MNLAVELKFWFYSNYWWILCFVLAVLAVQLYGTAVCLQVALPAIATLLSLVYFIQKQKIEELRLFREIFTHCNRRYDEMSERLSEILVDPNGAALTEEEKRILVDYFNLCGEEYLYYKHGHIYPDVWRAWRNGIRYYLEDNRVRAFWNSELDTNSYYGIPKNP